MIWLLSIINDGIAVTLASSANNIIAKEKMDVFAYISIYDSLGRLSVLYILYIVSADKLIVYAGLLAVLQLSIRIIYTVYCTRHFSEANGRWLWDKNISREVFTYAGWTVTGHLAIVGYTQGLNILLNIYF